MSPDRVFEGTRLAVELIPHADRTYEVVRSPAAAAVVATTPSDEIVLVRQFRIATGEVLTEVPAGLIDPGEEPAATAARELTEETGFVASSVEPIGSGFYATPGMSDERFWLFRASVPQHPSQERDDEAEEVILVPWAEALANARAGAYPDTKTALGILLAGA